MSNGKWYLVLGIGPLIQAGFSIVRVNAWDHCINSKVKSRFLPALGMTNLDQG